MKGGIAYYYQDFSRGSYPNFLTNYYDLSPTEKSEFHFISSEFVQQELKLNKSKELKVIIGFY